MFARLPPSMRGTAQIKAQRAFKVTSQTQVVLIKTDNSWRNMKGFVKLEKKKKHTKQIDKKS